ncbi:hypothetical protein DPMN_145210 [Dreissena polymorpha]|uniref:Uncharacterized protein n=1 Tax=Dreissena polymorpha TaxID=45954 RepID=A0A9D4IX99_DREPO|nr:hypothetical protein DPMN_145210 [Dreissena polymorpha]
MFPQIRSLVIPGILQPAAHSVRTITTLTKDTIGIVQCYVEEAGGTMAVMMELTQMDDMADRNHPQLSTCYMVRLMRLLPSP